MSEQSLRQHVQQQLQARLRPAATLWVGFSGGLDSTVLLYLLASDPAWRGKLRAVHINHGLSANAPAWQAHCAAVCQTLGVPLTVEQVSVAAGASVENAARQARYQAFARHLRQGDLLLLGHHADDQCETFFQRLFRGAGLNGLGAMAAVRELSPGIMLLRPLLACPRRQLEGYARRQRLHWVDDESNLDPRYERNWWRHELLPRIFARYPGKQAALLRSVQQLQQDQQLLSHLLQPHLQACLVSHQWPATASPACNIVSLSEQEARLQPYIVREWLQRLGYSLPSAGWLETLMQDVIQARPDARPQLLLGKAVIRRYGQLLCLTTPVAAAVTQTLALTDGLTLPWGGGQLTAVAASADGLQPGSYQLLPAAELNNRRLQPAGRPAKTLKALFQENRVPPWLRAGWPALVQDGQLAALAGLAVAGDFSTPEGGLTLGWQC